LDIQVLDQQQTDGLLVVEEEEQIQEIILELLELVVLDHLGVDHMLVVVMEVVLLLLMLEKQHLVEVVAEQLMVVE
jgi:selenocysteine-specific translation elongation factor|tara:strand:+ start:72 stop:299 length:228 start_codon:yes stop_codon:yes gene_type:complete